MQLDFAQSKNLSQHARPSPVVSPFYSGILFAIVSGQLVELKWLTTHHV